MNKSLLLLKIEQSRSEMLRLSEEHGITSEVVLQSSVQLDYLLNEYREKYEDLFIV